MFSRNIATRESAAADYLYNIIGQVGRRDVDPTTAHYRGMVGFLRAGMKGKAGADADIISAARSLREHGCLSAEARRDVVDHACGEAA